MSIHTAYLVGNPLATNPELQSALKALNLEAKPLDDDTRSTADYGSAIVIFDEFSGSLFDSLRKRGNGNAKARIFGPLTIIEAVKAPEKTIPTSLSGYPVFCCLLQNCVLSITGMKSKERMIDLRRKIFYMGGIFVERNIKVTHLIVEKVGGERYRDACAIGVPTLKPDFIDYLWNQRTNSKLDWQSNIAEWKCKAFYSLKVALEGFDNDLKVKMIKYLDEMDGCLVESDDPLVTHIVRNLLPSTAGEEGKVDISTKEEHIFRMPDMETGGRNEDVQSPTKRPRFELHVINDSVEKDPNTTPVRPIVGVGEKVKIVKDEWFWTTVQVEYCAFEEPYLVYPSPPVTSNRLQEELANTSLGTPTGIMSPNNYTLPLSDTDGGTPTSIWSGGSIGRRKRKRNRDFVRNEVLSSLILPDQPPRLITDIAEHDETINLGGNSLDSSEEVSDAIFATILKQVSEFLSKADYKSMSARQAEIAHLIETERNYVTILMNIVKNFKEPCENNEQAGGRILDAVEVKTIFHNILPIYSLHRRLLRDLIQLQFPWSEENLVGKVYCDHANEFRKAYEPFVNFFEAAKAEILRCESEKPRFLAFLRIAQGRAECGKQSLTDLMIRPIQRLPSTALILSTLSKRTKEPNPDAEWVFKALDAINKVNKAINEGKRVTEARIAMFDIYNEVDGCPVDIVSAQRSVLLKLDVQSLSDIWGQKNDSLTLVIFNDAILVVKRRSGGTNKHLSAAASVANLRSPSLSRKSMMVGPPATVSHHLKPYKFLEMVYHNSVVRVVDMTNAQTFALIIRAPHENRERTFGFTVPDDPTWPKMKLLNFLAKLAADSVDRLDYETKLATAEPGTLDFSGLSGSTVFDKASRFANKTRHKVTRALSMSRTPSKLKRTVSQMMSPFSSKSQPDPDAVSYGGMDCPTTPTPTLRSNMSTISLWGFGSRRGTLDSTPKARRTMSEKETKTTSSTIHSIQEI